MIVINKLIGLELVTFHSFFLNFSMYCILNSYFGLCWNISWSASRLFHVQSPDWRERWSRSVSFLCCIAAKLREQSVMKILVIADPWLKEREEDSTRLSVFISPSHAVTRKGYLITLYHPSHWESNVTPLHQDEQSTRISFFVVPWHWLPAILRGV